MSGVSSDRWWERLEKAHASSETICPYDEFPYYTRPDLTTFETGRVDCIQDNFLYISDLEGTSKTQRMGITCVVTLLNHQMMHHVREHEKHLRFSVADAETASLVDIIPMTTAFINKCRKNGGKVLVHCSAGISRSSSIIIAYLIQTKQMSLKDAYLYVKERRSVIGPNIGFMRQLNQI